MTERIPGGGESRDMNRTGREQGYEQDRVGNDERHKGEWNAEEETQML